MVRRIKHIVVYRRERDKLLANTKERMYLCCSNSGATIDRHFNGNAITENNYEQKKSFPLCTLTALSVSATAQTMNITRAGDTTIVKIVKSPQYLLLPIEEGKDERR